MAKAAKPKKEITMEEALWKSADKLRGSRMQCSVSRTFYRECPKVCVNLQTDVSALVFSMISKIEVALRVRLVEALLIHGELLVLQDPLIFKEKKRYWQNAATVASENAYFMDTGCFSIA